MAQYVIHKVGYWYTDEGFAIEQEKGSVLAITKSLDEAKAIKHREDITSLRNTTGISPMDFFSDSENFNDIYDRLETYYTSTFGTSLDDGRHAQITKQLSDEQAAQILSITGISFHTIVEYGDNEVINPDDFVYDEEEGDTTEF